MAATMSSKNIVVEWLKSLHLGQYAESFIDNGYDDLEICKQIGDPDLDAIGVLNTTHRNRLLSSIKTLREEGAASVYFTLEESQIIQENCKCDSDSKSSSEKLESPGGSARSRRSNSVTSLAGEFVDDYEEGKAQLVRIPKLQLKMLIRDKLHQDNVKLSAQPYSTQDGERGYLEGLASRYADLFNTHYRDVLVHLEDLRRREWAELSPRIKILGGANTPTTPPGPAPNSPSRAFPNSHLPTSQSQPIYVPGKYSPSSCLSDREEDEIYGFSGYGVYGKQMVQRQQQQAKLVSSASNNYHSCLSPRSAYFYEFPPNERASKKKTTFSRFLKTLKSSKHKDKGSPGASIGGNQANHNSPKHSTVNSRINTPDCLREPQTIYPPLDCERLRGGPGRPSNFEETINRLKLQDALEKKQRFDREHEEILRDIRTGLLHLNRSGAAAGQGTSDDTYMYDDEMLRHYGPHWYDEPPYESDPEDFLMVGQEQPNGRVCYTLSNRPESAHHHRQGRRHHGPAPLNPGAEATGGSVISLRSAGDISLPQSSQRGLLLPHTGLIIPLRGSNRNRESGDYAMSDVQSICSRLSSVSMETSRSDQIDAELYHRLRCCNGGDNMASPGHSSDYADEDLITLNSSCSTSTPLAPRTRIGGGKGDRRHAGRYYHARSKQSGGRAPRSNSSAESLPSTCSTQVLLEDRKGVPSVNGGANPSVVMTRAVALVDNSNSPYDKEALKFKKGDIINVISMCTSGLWRGYLAHDDLKRVGTFKFINVQLVPLDTSTGGTMSHHYPPGRKFAAHRSSHHANPMSSAGPPGSTTHKHRPKTLEQLLRTIDMEEHMSVFVLNGYEDLESFCEIKEEDLNYLKIMNPEHRAKILAAVQVMHEYESPEDDDESSLDGDDSSYSGKHARNNLDSELSADDTRSTNTTSTTIVSNNSSGGKTVGELDVSDTVVTCGDKIQVIKYVPGEVECESGNPTTPSRGSRNNTNTYCGFSEKSSDSGVSSSSVSSAHNVKQPLPARRCNGLPLGAGVSPSVTQPGGSKVAIIERSNRSYVGHFVRKTPGQSAMPLND